MGVRKKVDSNQPLNPMYIFIIKGQGIRRNYEKVLKLKKTGGSS